MGALSWSVPVVVARSASTACVAKNHNRRASGAHTRPAYAIGGGKGGGKEKAANMVVFGGADVDAAVAAAACVREGEGGGS